MMQGSLFLLLIASTGLAGFYAKSLSISGAVAAVAVGLAVYLGFGAQGLVLLGVFFASSSLWSKYKASLKKEMEEKLAKGSRRDWRQVFANGGTAAIAAFIYSFDQMPQWLLIFVVSIASANSDTWASEIGSLSKKNPLDIRSFKRVERGTSGAVSLLGSAAGLLGSLLIAGLAGVLFSFDLKMTVYSFLFGYLGNLIDTVLGASIQQAYHCSACGLKTEKKSHCGQPAKQIKGLRLIDNDMVNFLSGFLASLLAVSVLRFFS
ncbi:DUF92 domain-containing protein [Neobacillus sp. SM06]|uniref:DUF92 domain-containing protein n=1 Tax=Neobacillus sp. SM06 TaxID=3422492 RepID=UPI003D2A617A